MRRLSKDAKTVFRDPVMLTSLFVRRDCLYAGIPSRLVRLVLAREAVSESLIPVGSPVLHIDLAASKIGLSSTRCHWVELLPVLFFLA